MDIDIQKSKAKTVYLVPESPMTTPTATIYDREGDTFASPTATPVAVTTAIAATGSTATAIVVDSSTGIEPGHTLQVTSASWGTARSVVSSVDGTTIRLVTPLPAVPEDNDAVTVLDVEVEIPASSTLYTGYTLEVSEGNSSVRMTYNVVAYPFVGPCLPEHVRDVLSRQNAGERAYINDAQWQSRVANEVNDAIRGRLLASDTYLSDFWSPSALVNVRAPMLRLILAENYNLAVGSQDKDAWIQSTRFEVRDRIADILKSAQLYSKDKETIPDSDLTGRVVSWRR